MVCGLWFAGAVCGSGFGLLGFGFEVLDFWIWVQG